MAAQNQQEKWDVHTHTTPAPETFDALARFSHYENFVRVRAESGDRCRAALINHRGEAVRHLHRNAWDAQARLAECDAHHVTMQVLSPTPMMLPDYVESEDDAAEICRILNDGNAEIAAEFPARFTALAALPMHFPDAAMRELERVRRLGMRGFEINSNIGGIDLDHPDFFPVFQAAAHSNMAVFIHPWGGFMSPSEGPLRLRMHAQRNWRPWLIGMGMETALAFDAMRCGAVHERLPNLRVLYAHGGGAFPAMLGRLEHGAYSRPDLFRNSPRLNPFQTVHECAVYTDSLTHDPWMLHLLLQHLGAKRIAMGSDYPYPLGEVDPFDGVTQRDTHGNQRPYAQAKDIHPGHMVERLPENESEIEAAWRHFHWLPRGNADGPRDLPMLSAAEKQQILSGTAKEWLRWS